MVFGSPWWLPSRNWPSNQDGINVSNIKLIATHDCYRCIALLDKYYGHRRYRIHFTHTELQCRNHDARLRNGLNLIDNYMREDIEVEYILDCYYTELQVQSSPDIQNVLANSVLEFIWKIGDRSSLYITETYRKKLQLFRAFQSQQSSFDDFVWAFLDQNYQQV